MAEMVNRRRVATTIKVLPPEVVPFSPEDHQQAAAMTEMIEQWWRDRHDGEPSVQPADGPTPSGGSIGSQAVPGSCP
jgi:hypothetical protein